MSYLLIYIEDISLLLVICSTYFLPFSSLCFHSVVDFFAMQMLMNLIDSIYLALLSL